MRLFNRHTIHGAGAGAIYLRREKSLVAVAELAVVTDSFLFTSNQARAVAAQKMRAQLPPDSANEMLCAGVYDNARMDAAENLAWCDWTGTRLAPKAILGEAFVASAACAVRCGVCGGDGRPGLSGECERGGCEPAGNRGAFSGLREGGSLAGSVPEMAGTINNQ